MDLSRALTKIPRAFFHRLRKKVKKSSARLLSSLLYLSAVDCTFYPLKSRKWVFANLGLNLFKIYWYNRSLSSTNNQKYPSVKTLTVISLGNPFQKKTVIIRKDLACRDERNESFIIGWLLFIFLFSDLLFFLFSARERKLKSWVGGCICFILLCKNKISL